MELKYPDKDLLFLSGGGEMGALTRTKDWSKTSIGDPVHWPQSLRTALSIILNSKFPMFLFWGEGLVCFYNDAYRPSLGKDGKHPSILGMKGEEAWPEIWHIIKPLIDRVFAGGEATWSEDQLIPIYRNGRMEDVYWTFSYSPVHDETGKPAGVFVTCNETTEKVLAYRNIAESREELRFAIEATELGTWDFNPLTNKFTANERLKEWFGLPPGEQIELSNAVNVMLESDRERVTVAIQKALEFSSGGTYDMIYTIVHPVSGKQSIVHAKGKAWFGDDKIAYRFNGTLQDITQEALAIQKIKENEEQLRKTTEHFEIATNAAEVGTWTYYPRTNALEWSGLHKKMWGYDEHNPNLDYEDWHKLILPEDKEAALAEVEKALVTKRPYEAIYRIQKPGSSDTRWIRSTGQYFYDEAGEPVTLTGVSIDITELKNAELVIRENEERFHNLIYSSPSAIGILMGPELVITIGNEPILEIWGKGEQIIGQKYFEALPELAEQGYKEVFAQVYDTGIPFNAVETPVYILQNGIETLKYYNFVIYPQRNTTGEVIGLGIIATEVTSHAILNYKIRESEQQYRELSLSLEEKVKARTAELNANNAELQKMNKELESFAYISSHDLQEPLRKIQTFASFIVEGEGSNLSETAKSHFKKMQNAAMRMQTLINDLLAYSRTGSADRTFEKTDLEIIIDEVKEDLKDEINEKHAVIKSSGSCEVNIIPFQFRQLMLNLVSNALKFSIPETTPVIKIQSETGKGKQFNDPRLSAEKLYCHIRVSDNGIGFEPQYSEKIFEVFQRLHGKSAYAGTGIGLSIVKKIVENHDGIITATGELNKGAAFDIYLPAD